MQQACSLTYSDIIQLCHTEMRKKCLMCLRLIFFLFASLRNNWSALQATVALWIDPKDPGSIVFIVRYCEILWAYVSMHYEHTDSGGHASIASMRQQAPTGLWTASFSQRFTLYHYVMYDTKGSLGCNLRSKQAKERLEFRAALQLSPAPPKCVALLCKTTLGNLHSQANSCLLATRSIRLGGRSSCDRPSGPFCGDCACAIFPWAWAGGASICNGWWRTFSPTSNRIPTKLRSIPQQNLRVFCKTLQYPTQSYNILQYPTQSYTSLQYPTNPYIKLI